MCHWIAAVVLVSSAPGISADILPKDAVASIVTRLQQNQVASGSEQGLWPGEELFMGPITAGVACAYDWTGNITYMFTARSGAGYLLRAANLQSNLLGEEACALVKMSEIHQKDLNGQPGAADEWRGATAAFYYSLSWNGSTQAYIDFFNDLEPSENVLFFAHHVLAAYYVDDPDKDLWRDALIAQLSRVDDESSYPVMALGVATWALAKIDKLDDTPVTGPGRSSYWDGVTLRDLPGLLLSHQVPLGELFAGSFYWRFDHSGGNSQGLVAGFTEDSVYGTLGLAAAASLKVNLQNEDMKQAVLLAQEALLQGVSANGTVCEHLSRQGEIRHAFAGEMLQGLWGVQEYLAARAGAQSEEPAHPVEGQN
jgi:hypothetical protein